MFENSGSDARRLKPQQRKARSRPAPAGIGGCRQALGSHL